jgi:hypothetical protein
MLRCCCCLQPFVSPRISCLLLVAPLLLLLLPPLLLLRLELLLLFLLAPLLLLAILGFQPCKLLETLLECRHCRRRALHTLLLCLLLGLQVQPMPRSTAATTAAAAAGACWARLLLLCRPGVACNCPCAALRCS